MVQDHLDLRAARGEEGLAQERGRCRWPSRPGAPEPGGDRPRPAAGHAVRHGAGDPVRLAPARGRATSTRPMPPFVHSQHPALRTPLARLAVLAAVRGSFETAHAAITSQCGHVMGKRQIEQAIMNTTGTSPPSTPPASRCHPPADAAGDLEDSKRVMMRPGRCHRPPPGHPPAGAGSSHPAGGRGRAEPQADGHAGGRVRLRHRRRAPTRRDRPARRAARPPPLQPARARAKWLARWSRRTRSGRGDHRRVRPGRSPRPGPPADLGDPMRGSRARASA